MWSLGLWLVLFGYALFYTGFANFRNGGTGPSLSESIGLSSDVKTESTA